MKNVIILIILCIPFISCVSTNTDELGNKWYTGFPKEKNWEELENNEVYRSLIIPVLASHIASANLMLNGNSFIKVDIKFARKYLNMPFLNPDSLLKSEISNSLAIAEEKEKEARDPFFIYHKEMFLNEAESERKKARRANEILGKTEPYLIRAIALNEGTGSFSAYWVDGSLLVFHGSLGRSEVPMKKHPLIVFLEKEPEKVYIDVSMAE